MDTDIKPWSFKQIAIELLIVAVIGLLFGFLGPFGTYAMPVALRLAYWVGFIIVGYTIFRPVSISAGWLTESTGISIWVTTLMATAVAALPLTFLIGFAISGMRFDRLFFGGGFLLLYLQCAVIGFGIFCFMRMLFRRAERDQEQAPEDRQAREDSAPDRPKAKPVPEHIEPVRAKLYSRLPPGFSDPIVALGVEDHYVRVHASQRGEMLLMRFSDAIAEMDDIQGMQVHRSWWVARDAILTSKRDGRNLRLSLCGGLEVPVSRAYVTKLKQTGWI